MTRLAGASITLFALLLAAPAAAGPSGYQLKRRIPVGGSGGWDYISFDGASHRLFVAHHDRVEVLDSVSGKLLGQVRDTPGVHGVALAGELGLGFISAGRAGTVVVFDLKTLARRTTIKVGRKPDAILFDAFSGRVLCFNKDSSDLSIIDARQQKVVHTLALGGQPEFGVSDGKGRVYVNLEDRHELAVLDPKAGKLLARWPLGPCREPTGLAIDVAHQRLFSVCESKHMVVLDARSGALVATLPIGARVDGCAFDPGTGYALASNGEGTLTVVREESPSKLNVLETVKTERGARTLALDPKTHTVYLPTAVAGGLVILELRR
jgi:DNA-binding beta-propeller fold protein YncE